LWNYYKKKPEFEILQIQDRLFQKGKGNRVVLINVAYTLPQMLANNLKKNLHPMFCPSWFQHQNKIRMIVEIQVAVKELHTLDKKFRSVYEIVRCPTFAQYSSSLEKDPCYKVSEDKEYPLGLLYGDPNFLF